MPIPYSPSRRPRHSPNAAFACPHCRQMVHWRRPEAKRQPVRPQLKIRASARRPKSLIVALGLFAILIIAITAFATTRQAGRLFKNGRQTPSHSLRVSDFKEKWAPKLQREQKPKGRAWVQASSYGPRPDTQKIYLTKQNRGQGSRLKGYTR